MNNYFRAYHELVLNRILVGATGLYTHQREALLAIYQKACRTEMDAPMREAALILAGVGTGKTLIQAIAPFLLAPWMLGRKALFLSDNCTLRGRFLRDFPTNRSGRPIYSQWLLYSLKILPPGVPPPKIVELDAGNFESYAYAMDSADMLVGNRQFVLNLVNRGDIEPDTVGVLVVDEAHFSAAASYRTITNYFDKALLTYFTGSKFRSDSQPLPHVRYTEVSELDDRGNSVVRYAPAADYEFSLQDAWKLDPPPIKKLTLQEATSEAFLIEEDGIEMSYNPEDFLAKAESDRLWFRQILLADSFSMPVLQMAVDVLLSKRKATGQPHSMIVRALNIAHTHRVAKLLEENFPYLKGRVGIIHSDHDSYDLAGRPSDILQRFYNGQDWVLVHCGMLGVGFDHLWASVSCCLCILKTMSPAEQEWGRIIRRVPGEPPGKFPKLEHPNWGVVVTHESLGIRPLFEQFLEGVNSDTLTEVTTPMRRKPILTAEYEAGDTVLSLSDTDALKPGDILELEAIISPQETPSPKFDLAKELGNTESFSVREEGGRYHVQESEVSNQGISFQMSLPMEVDTRATVPPWEAEVEAISDRLSQIRSVRTVSVQVEAVLDSEQVQITPTWLDLPTGAKVKRQRSLQSLPDAHFLSHVNLDWQVLVGSEFIPYSEYKKRVLLQSKGLELTPDGEIAASGVPLSQTMPPAVYEMFLKGLEAELASTEVEVPHSEAIARPDKAKMETQARYGGLIKSLIHDLFRQRRLIPDGASGNSLVERPVKLLVEAMERVKAKGHEVSFKNNQQLIHSAVFGHIKETTGRSWSEHNSGQYQQAYQKARVYVMRLREQLQWQYRARSRNSAR
ncbi:MAG: DEAD/DEAH box helicase [Xenococcaceae cyanobacterium]